MLQQGCATGKFWLFCIFCFSFSDWINAKEPKCGLAKHRLSVRLYFAMSIVRSALVAYNGSGVWHSGFDLKAGTVNLAQN
jgi:hypothetical protein